MRSISTLRLSDKERQLFLAALKHYGYENAADFLRAAARALVAHHRLRDKLEPLLRFQLQPVSERASSERYLEPPRA